MINNISRRNLFLSVFLPFYMVSCVTKPDISHFSPVYLTDKSRFFLLPAADIEKPLDCAQQISLYYNGQEITMNAWVRADENGIEMTLFNTMGINMGEFSFKNSAIILDSPVFPGSFKAEYLAADFQLCYFRPDALKKALLKIGLLFEVIKNDDSNGAPVEIRRISESGKTILEIEKKRNEIRYTNFLRGYGYTLKEAD